MSLLHPTHQALRHRMPDTVVGAWQSARPSEIPVTYSSLAHPGFTRPDDGLTGLQPARFVSGPGVGAAWVLGASVPVGVVRWSSL